LAGTGVHAAIGPVAAGEADGEAVGGVAVGGVTGLHPAARSSIAIKQARGRATITLLVDSPEEQ
jgi:hypothetical protein